MITRLSHATFYVLDQDKAWIFTLTNSALR